VSVTAMSTAKQLFQTKLCVHTLCSMPDQLHNRAALGTEQWPKLLSVQKTGAWYTVCAIKIYHWHHKY